MTKKWLVAALLVVALVIRLVPVLDSTHFWPLVDDSYYALSVARNIAEGNGVTYSGLPTNGFQPLYVFMSVPFYLVFGHGDVRPITCILLVLALISAGTGYLIYGLLKRIAGEFGALFGLVVWALSPYVVEHGINGLETPLTSFFLVASAWFYVVRIRGVWPVRVVDLLAFGVMLGLGVLARVSMGLWAAAVAIDMVFCAAGISLVKRFAGTVIITCAAVVICLPWFLYSFSVSESIVPTGGQAVSFISRAYGYNHWGERFSYFPVDLVPLKYYLLSVKSSLSEIFQAFDFFSGLFTARGALFVVLVVGVALRKSIWKTVQQFPFLLLFPVFEIGAYSFCIFGQWFYARYYYATVVSFLLLICILYERVVGSVPFVRRYHLWVICCVALILLGMSWGSVLQRCLRREFISVDVQRKMSNAIMSAVPPGEAVGAFQSGATEYFVRDRHVMNLDGVVNYGALKAMKEMRMEEYLSTNKIKWLVDWSWIIDALYVRRSTRTDALASWEKISEWGDMTLYKRKIIAGRSPEN